MNFQQILDSNDTARLEMLYLDYFNDFLTVRGFAEYWQECTQVAQLVIDAGREINHGNV